VALGQKQAQQSSNEVKIEPAFASLVPVAVIKRKFSDSFDRSHGWHGHCSNGIGSLRDLMMVLSCWAAAPSAGKWRELFDNQPSSKYRSGPHPLTVDGSATYSHIDCRVRTLSLTSGSGVQRPAFLLALLFDLLQAIHERPKRFRNDHTPILLLIVLDQRKPQPAYSQA
jgi:hypothetical protein